MMIKMTKTLNGTLGLTSKEDGWENHLNVLLEDRNSMIGEPISSRKKIQKKKNHLLQLPLLQGARCLRKQRCMAILMDL